MATISQAVERERPRRFGGRGAFGILLIPVVLLIVLFLAPMLIMVVMSIVRFPPNTSSGYTLKVLERAGFITRGKDAQRRPARLRPEAIRDVADWSASNGG